MEHCSTRKPPVFHQFHPFHLENGKSGKQVEHDAGQGGTGPDFDERAGMAADRVPAVYLDAWARLQCHKPATATDQQWRLVINDAGLFLDRWGSEAAKAGWTAGDLFDMPGGLVWFICRENVEVIGSDHARMGDGCVHDLASLLTRRHPIE